MSATSHSSPGATAFGAPGIKPQWTSSAKEGLGTAYHTSCRLWFTLSHGIVNEIYYPTVDQPNTRDFQFLISDGETFCHEEKRDLIHELEYPALACPYYRLTNSEPNGRYRIIKDIVTDPHRSVLLVRTKVEILDESLRGRLRLYALLAPHMVRQGADNSGCCTEVSGHNLIHAGYNNFHLAMGCSENFSRRSVGYVGASDGWTDLMDNFHMDWEFRSAEHGNIALIGEIASEALDGESFMIALALGRSFQSSVVKLLQSLAEPFEVHRDSYVRQWQAARVTEDAALFAHTGDGGSMYRLSRCILLAHEDKLFEGALIASMSIPWGEAKGDDDLGGYHLVWTRDMVQSATALLATGQTGTPLRALIWLAAIQRDDGSFPQNSWIDGTAYWPGLQLDEIAAPILLAWRLRRAQVDMGKFNPCTMILRGAAFLMRQGPVTHQERWEEASGYSPSTLAVVIAGLVCAADFARVAGDADTEALLLEYADWLAAHIEDWTVTTAGELVPGCPKHYIRVNPSDPHHPDPHADPNTTEVSLANGGGRHPAKSIVGGDFLNLVRLGIRPANDPAVVSSINVIDHIIKYDLPQGPCWRRYNFDGYGQKDDGAAFDGTGVGRSWPILTGERGHYELAAGRDPTPYIVAIEKFANNGGMICEQVWDGDDLPGGKMKRGEPSGSAMPLCWSHAEYISLVRSSYDGVCFDRVEPAYRRYVAQPIQSLFEMWTFRHQTRRIPGGKTLRLIVDADAEVRWSADGWATTNTRHTAHNVALDLRFADLPVFTCPEGTSVEFTFFWKEAQHWEGKNFVVAIESPTR
ncbi:MAG TPA: glycoside hydrolase family 15 protein [Candidatus Methylacidiphilales bacterium]|nr:glycoside hydrolase family 15 protein [Candidatus Methylacidiphilales bacterium]